MEAKRRVAARFHVALEPFRCRPVLCHRLFLAEILKVVRLTARNLVLVCNSDGRRTFERIFRSIKRFEVNLRGLQECESFFRHWLLR